MERMRVLSAQDDPGDLLHRAGLSTDVGAPGGGDRSAIERGHDPAAVNRCKFEQCRYILSAPGTPLPHQKVLSQKNFA
jgi:hypothetical protein